MDIHYKDDKLISNYPMDNQGVRILQNQSLMSLQFMKNLIIVNYKWQYIYKLLTTKEVD